MSCLFALFDDCGEDWRQSLVDEVLTDRNGAAKYKVVRVIGHGGMGVVYEVADLFADRKRRAIKIVAPLSAPDVVERFREESQILAMVDGIDGICSINEVSECDHPIYQGMPFIVMDLISGIGPLDSGGKLCLSLDDYLRKSPARLSERQAAYIIRRCAQALANVHRLKNPAGEYLAHRDLKPQNILLKDSSDKGEVHFRTYIIDFGLAAPGALGKADFQTQSSHSRIEGTVAYMAPEQFNGQADTRSDIWALGAILFEMLVGELPFPTPEKRTSIASLKSRFATPPQLSKIRDPDLRRICQACLSQDPALRPDAKLLRDHLDRWLNKLPIEPASYTRKLSLGIQRHPVATVVLMSALLILAGSIAAVFNYRSQRDQILEQQFARYLSYGNEQRDRSEGSLGLPWFGAALRETKDIRQRDVLRRSIQTTIPLLPKVTQLYAHEEPVRTFAYGPSGDYIAVSSGKFAIVWPAVHGELAPKPVLKIEHETPVYNCSINQSGDRLLSMAEDGILRLYSFPEGALLTTLTLPGGDIRRSGFDKTGTRVLATVYFSEDYRNEVCVWDAQAGEVQHRLSHEGNFITDAGLSPDGTKLAAVTITNGVWLWDLADASHKVLPVPQGQAVNAVAFNKSGTLLAIGGLAQNVELWDVATQTLLEPKLPTTPIKSISFSDDDAVLIVQPNRGPIQLWDANTKKELPGLEAYPIHLKFPAGTVSHNSRHVLEVDQTRRLLRVNATANNHSPKFSVQTRGMVFSAKFSPDRKFLAVTSNEPLSDDQTKQQNVVRIYEWQDGENRYKDVLSESYSNTFLSQLEFSSDSRKLYAGGSKLVEFDLTKSPIAPLVLNDESYSQMFLEPNSKLLYGSSLGPISRFDLSKPEEPAVEIGGSQSGVFVLGPTGRRLLVLRSENSKSPIRKATIVETGKSQQALDPGILVPLLYVPSRAAFSPNEDRVVLPTEDGYLAVCDTTTGKSVFKMETADAYFAEFDRTGKHILSHGQHLVQIWNAKDGSLEFSTSFTDAVSRTSLSPDGNLFSVAVGNAAQVWDVNTRQPLTPYWVHANLVSNAQFSPDGNSVLTVAMDGIVRLWDISDDSNWSDTELVELSELVSDRKIAVWQELPLSQQEALSIWKSLTSEPSRPFETTAQEEMQFRWEQILYCEKTHSWKQAVLHWKSLLANPEYKGTANDWQRLAQTYVNLQQWQEAVDAYVKAFELAPSNGYYAETIGWCYGRKEDRDESQKYYLRAEELGRSNGLLFKNMAGNYVAAGDYASAAIYLGKVRTLEPTKAANWRAEAAALLAAGQVDQYHKLSSELLASKHISSENRYQWYDSLIALYLDPSLDLDKRIKVAAFGKNINSNISVEERNWLVALIRLRAEQAAGDVLAAAEQSMESRGKDAAPLEWLVAALCLHRMDEKAKSQEYLAKASKWLGEAKAAQRIDLVLPMLLEVEALKREFEAEMSRPLSLVDLFSNGNIEALRKQIEALDAALLKDENNAELLAKRGSALAMFSTAKPEESRWEDALSDFEAATQAIPQTADWWRSRYLCLNQSDEDDADTLGFLEDLESEYDSHPDNVALLWNYLWALSLQDKPLTNEQKLALGSPTIHDRLPKLLEFMSADMMAGIASQRVQKIRAIQILMVLSILGNPENGLASLPQAADVTGPEVAFESLARSVLCSRSDRAAEAKESFEKGDSYLKSEKGKKATGELSWQQQAEITILRRLAEKLLK